MSSPRFRIRNTRVLSAGAVNGRLLVIGIAARRVRWVAIADRERLDSARALKRALRRSR